jgi:hypothetical protein
MSINAKNVVIKAKLNIHWVKWQKTLCIVTFVIHNKLV